MEQSNANILDRTLGMLVGLAVGDAVGTTLEFKPRGSFEPMSDMMGGGPFQLEAGQWTDDTSMALCLAQSLILERGFNPEDQMKRYCNWHRFGYMSVTGECFDIGNTVRAALRRFLENGDPFAGSTEPSTAGNGSIMRLAPVVMAYWQHDGLLDLARDSSRTTHSCDEAVEACAVFADMLRSVMQGKDKAALVGSSGFTSSAVSLAVLQSGEFLEKDSVDLKGTGYVVDSLEAALWCFHHTDNFRDAVLAAANLGDDADTTAAVCGQIAGAYYGHSGIPLEWRERLHWHDKIRDIAEQFFTEPTHSKNTVIGIQTIN